MQRFCRDCGIYFPTVAIVNRHRKGVGYSSTISNGNLKEAGTNFASLCNDPVEDDSALVISILELFNETIFINAVENCDGSDDFGQWDEHICCKNTLSEQIFARTSFCWWSLKFRFLSISIRFILWLIQYVKKCKILRKRSFPLLLLIFFNSF